MSTAAKQTREIFPTGSDFTVWVKMQLAQRRKNVRWLARRVRKHRTTVSTAIHNDRFPRTRAAIVKVLS